MDLPERIGRYDVVRLLGQGGMGRVVLARDTVLGRFVALKTLRDDLGLTPEHRTSLFERMRNEVRAAATLSHPNIVVLHDMGQDPDHGLFLVFEYVEGPTLRDRIGDGALPPLEVARLARELGSALSLAHAAGVVHRDVKPENIIVSVGGARLTDFGIARIPDSTLTRAGVTMGTPAYSAPEALAKGEFSPESDQFSLAATLFEALSGRRAFDGDDALAVAGRIASGERPRLADGEEDLQKRLVLRRVDGVLARAFSSDPRQRYASCQAFGDALAAAIDVRASGAYATLPPFDAAAGDPRTTRRWQNLVAAGALLVIVGLAVAGRPGSSGASLAKVQQELNFALAAHAVSPPSRPAPSAAPPRAKPQAPRPAGSQSSRGAAFESEAGVSDAAPDAAAAPAP